MQALAEAEVALPPAGDVEAVGVGEPALVAVGRAVDQHDAAPGRDGDPVQLDRARGGAPDELQRGRDPDRLLHRRGGERRVAQQQGPLVGVLRQQPEQRAGQAGGGLHPAEEQHHHQAEHLRGRRQVLVGERHAVDLRLHEVRHEVRAGSPPALLEQADEVLLDAGGGALGHRRQPRVAGYSVLELVHPPGELLAPLLPRARQAEDVEEDLVGQRPRELLREVDLVAPGPRRDQARARRRGCRPPGLRPAAAGSGPARARAPGRAAGCRGRAGTPARSGPSRCRRCRCPRSCGRCRDRSRQPARRRTATAPTSPSCSL